MAAERWSYRAWQRTRRAARARGSAHAEVAHIHRDSRRTCEPDYSRLATFDIPAIDRRLLAETAFQGNSRAESFFPRG